MTNTINSIKEKLQNGAKSEAIDPLLFQRIMYLHNRRKMIVNLYGNDEHEHFSS